MEEFKVNEYITLKLEDSKTNIYIYNREKEEYELFDHCKYVLLRKTVYELEDFLENIESVDELAEHLDHLLEEYEPEEIDIPAETQFWVHCSNMQVWAENNYDSRLIHSNLVFPLLKRLSRPDINDTLATKILKREIIERYSSGFLPVIEYLTKEKYLEYLNEIELRTLRIKTSKVILDRIRDSDHRELLKMLYYKFYRYLETPDIINIIENMNKGNIINLIYIMNHNYGFYDKVINDFFKAIEIISSDLEYKLSKKILENCNKKDLINVLYHIKSVNLSKLLCNKKSNLFIVLMESINSILEYKNDEDWEIFRDLKGKLYTSYKKYSKTLKKRTINFLESGEVRIIIKLQWLELLSDSDFEEILNDKNLKFVKKIMNLINEILNAKEKDFCQCEFEEYLGLLNRLNKHMEREQWKEFINELNIQKLTFNDCLKQMTKANPEAKEKIFKLLQAT